MTVARWTLVQNECFQDGSDTAFKSPAHERLFDHIEDRTFGKRYQAEVAIGFGGAFLYDLKPILAEAVAAVETREAAQ